MQGISKSPTAAPLDSPRTSVASNPWDAESCCKCLAIMALKIAYPSGFKRQLSGALPCYLRGARNRVQRQACELFAQCPATRRRQAKPHAPMNWLSASTTSSAPCTHAVCVSLIVPWDCDSRRPPSWIRMRGAAPGFTMVSTFPGRQNMSKSGGVLHDSPSTFLPPVSSKAGAYHFALCVPLNCADAVAVHIHW